MRKNTSLPTAAVAAADSALQALLTGSEPRAISRRDLLRGNLARP
jgi:hypothetical protein